MRALKLSRALARLERHLADQGLTFQAHDDFRKFAKAAKRVRTKRVSGEFDGSAFDHHAENGFWTEVRCGRERISVHATRYEYLGKRTLAEHLPSQQPRVYGRSGQLVRTCPQLAHMKGHVCYSGEFEITADWAGKDLAGVIVFMNFLVAYIRWPELQWIWGLMNERLAVRGMASSMGFSYAIPDGVSWSKDPNNISSKDWLVALSADDVEHWATVIAERGVEPLQRR